MASSTRTDIQDDRKVNGMGLYSQHLVHVQRRNDTHAWLRRQREAMLVGTGIAGIDALVEGFQAHMSSDWMIPVYFVLRFVYLHDHLVSWKI